MKTSLIKKLLIAVLPIALIISLTIGALNGKPGGRAGYTSSFREATCAASNCHTDYIVNLPNGYVRMNGTLLTTLRYTPGNTYNLSVTVSKVGATLFGFGLEAIFANGSNAGTLTPVSSDVRTPLLVAGNGRNNLTHNGIGNATANSHTFSFTWTAPPAGAGDVYFFMTGAACNNDGGETGDYVYSKRYVIKP